MQSLFAGSAKRTLQKMIKKGLLKIEDLDKPSEGWYLSNGYERENGTGKWVYIERTLSGARSMIPRDKLPQWKNLLRNE